MEKKYCLECQAPLNGRADKRFCNDNCRNAYNNQRNRAQNNVMRRINHILLKNRSLLAAQIPENVDYVKIKKEKLQEMGLQLPYHTHSYKNIKGQTYFFCYEYGYLELEGEWLLVVKDKNIS